MCVSRVGSGAGGSRQRGAAQRPVMQMTRGVERGGGGFGVRKVEFRFEDEGAEEITFPGPHPQIGKAPNPKFGKEFSV